MFFIFRNSISNAQCTPPHKTNICVLCVFGIATLLIVWCSSRMKTDLQVLISPVNCHNYEVTTLWLNYCSTSCSEPVTWEVGWACVLNAMTVTLTCYYEVHDVISSRLHLYVYRKPRIHIHTGICPSTHSFSHADSRSWLKITHTWVSSVWQIGSHNFALHETQREMVYQTAFQNYSHIAFTDKDKGVRTDKSIVVVSI